jgi:uncharacterized protein (TIGR03437 family)
VTATVGGQPATVVSATAAPYAPAGIVQVNLTIPAGAPTGPRVPLVLTVNGDPSEDFLPGAGHVTIAVR